MQAVIRTLSFFEQWLAEVLRQPALMFTLVVAPFLLLLAFGEGVEIGGPRPKTLIVQEEGAQQPVEPLLEGLEEEVEIVGVSESLPLARQSLRRGDVDAVAVVPGNPNEIIESGERVPIQVLLGEIDPVRRSYARAYLNDQIAALNQRAVAEALTQVQGDLGQVNAVTDQAQKDLDAVKAAESRDEARRAASDLQTTVDVLDPAVFGVAAAGVLQIPGLAESVEGANSLPPAIDALQRGVADLNAELASGPDDEVPTEAEVRPVETALDDLSAASDEISKLDPNVLSAPFRLEMEDVTPITPSFTAFYSPGVVSLLVQHLAITLGALTLARMRLLRVTDTLRVAPVRTLEIVLGNYLSYFVLCALASVALVAMLVLGVSVPVVGSYLMVAVIIGLLILTSLGFGFLASQLSSSVQQATQIAMLLLLASIFFAGFTFSLDRIDWPVRAISYALPSTYAIRSLQDVMLRGFEPSLVDVGVLAVAGISLFLINAALLGRTLRAAPAAA